ncbi:MAG: hypothetical protein FWE22_05080 [Firmicutes bacterium]|nr:hypothetical protein [Bacillota bacterium]
MKSAIRQMYYGERGSFEEIKPTKKYFELLENFVELEDKLNSKLALYPEILVLYEKIIELKEESESELRATCYVEGFRFGSLFGMEITGE